MSIFNKVSIGSSMLTTFILIILITISFGVFSISGMDTLGKLTDTLYNHPLRVSNAALTAQSSIIRMQRDMKELIITKDAHYFTQVEAELNKEEEKVYSEFDILSKYILGDRGYNLVIEAKEDFSKWKSLRDSILHNLKEGNYTEAQKISSSIGDGYAKMLERKMSGLTMYARNKADGFIANAEVVQQTIYRNTLFMLGFLIFSLLFFSWIVMKHVVGRISNLKDALKKNIRKNTLIEIEEIGSNEITDLAKSFNDLIKAINRQLWLIEGVNNLNQQLMDLDNLDSFEKPLSFVSKYISAGIGAIFHFDPSSGDSALISSYALDGNQNKLRTVPLGVGFVGQVAKDWQEIQITGQINEPLSGKSYTGEMLPHSIFLIPLIFKNELVGIAEFAKMEPFKEIEIEFIRFSGAFLAGALNSIKNRTQIDELYEATIASNKKLTQQKVENEEMNFKLSKRNKELAEKTKELESQTEELTNLARQLEEQKEELEIKQSQVEQSDKLKSEFLSNMSHELRTPLNSILALSQLMLKRRSDQISEKETEYITVIERNGRLLLSLISNILDLSKIESGKMEMNITTFDARLLANEVLETIRPLAEKKGLELRSSIIFKGEMTSDRYKVLQILLNLCSNAVKFTESGFITLHLEKEGREIIFTISDSGIGISQDKLDYIFGEFQQVDGSASKRHDGTGLGLSISRKFARMLGGDITVESNSGNGSSFKLTLSEQYCKGNRLSDVPYENAEPALGTKQVLIVDDTKSHREQLRTYLEEAGYSAVECSNGSSALKLASQKKFYAIILDILMPDMDGLEVLKQLKEDKETENIPVILISVSNIDITGSILGAAGYLAKPPQKEQLINQLEALDTDEYTDFNEKFGEGKTILAVEDNPENVMVLKEVLELFSGTLIVASDGEQAIPLAQSEEPDIILMDIHLPGMTGTEAAQIIRKQPINQTTPIVAITARAMAGEREKFIEAGCDDYLAKPYTPESMIKTIQKWLKAAEK